MKVQFNLSTLVICIGCTVLLLLVSFSMVLVEPSVDMINGGKNRAASDLITWNNYRDYVVDIDYSNSTHIFNSIFAALKQSPADIHPLGVTYFPAVVPKGTLMYRAGKKDIPESFEWLAMDHEFSYSFGSRFSSYGRKSLRKGPARQKPKDAPNNSGTSNEDNISYLMTFRATRDMNKFIYLDGASAAKSQTGEMDTQQMLYDVLKKHYNYDDDGEKKRLQERDYAALICKWGKPLGLDGLVRVEIGFEIILCDFFKDNIELVSNLTLNNPANELGLPAPTVISKENGWPLDDNGTLLEDQLTSEQSQILEKEDYWQSILENYSLGRQFNWLQVGNAHDSGDKRVKLDYRHMITGVNRVPMDPKPMKRRLLNDQMTDELQFQMFKDLELSLNNNFDYTESNNWQEIFEEFVNKFSPMLKIIEKILHSEKRTAEEVAVDITKFTLNFIMRFKTTQENDATRGSGEEFAIYQYSRPPTNLVTESDFLIWSANVRIAEKIVHTIYQVNDLLMPIVKGTAFDDNSIDELKQKSVEQSRTLIDELIDTLNWISLHYRCEQVCDWDEICFTPSWGPGPLAGGFGRNNNGNKIGFGKHLDEDAGRQVINYNLQCVNIDTLLSQN